MVMVVSSDQVVHAVEAGATIATVLGAHLKTRAHNRRDIGRLRQQVGRLRQELAQLRAQVDRWSHLP